jgi:WD40 repeat protein
MLSVHDGMHRSPISAAASSLNGQWLVTGCIDSTVRVWKYDNQNILLKATLCGHEGSRITCIDVSTVFGMIVTGSANGDVLLWDLRTLTFMRRLRHAFKEEAANVVGSISYNPTVSVSINHKNGYVVTLVGSHLSIFDINGSPLASVDPGSQNRATCAVATDCPEWMEQGIVAVTGHLLGEIRLWSLDHDAGEFIMRHIMPDNPHSCPITALRVVGERQEILLVGDKSGRMTICKTMQLESLNQDELATVVEEVRSKVKMRDAPLKKTG